MTVADEKTLEILFTEARSQNGWTDQVVTDAELQEAYDIAKWGPTSMNIQPFRVVFLRSLEAKERLKPALKPGNVEEYVCMHTHPDGMWTDPCGVLSR